ncbi:MAG: ABC transporter permease [Oscillospiraceae bacterium]|nr:ABC transporter permease [Oscillospiraceae bacterium]
MKRTFYWFSLLNKRLYKKPVFIVILALIPLLMFSFGIAAQGDSGLIHITLARTDKNDALSQDITTGLLERNGLILFTESSSPEEALDMVKSGKADAAWVFPDDTAGKVEAFSANASKSNYVVDVFQREETIPLRLSREVLSSEVFEHCSRNMYINYIRKNIEGLNSVADSDLYKHYDEFEKDTELFQFSDTENTALSNSKNYLLSPLRGLLSVIVLLCGLAATMFFMQDKKSGTFSLIPEHKLPMVGFICQLIAILNVGIVMLISLFVSGLSVSFLREIAMLILFCISCASFCSILHFFVRDIKFLGALIPLIIILSIAICPVFFDFNSVHLIQQLFPPTHYINAVYDNTALLFSAIYCGASFALFLLFSKLHRFVSRSLK